MIQLTQQDNLTGTPGPVSRTDNADVSPVAEWSPIARLALIAALAVLAYGSNMAHLPVPYGMDLIFGSIWVMVALTWLGPVAGVSVALVGGTYSVALWNHPYALVIFAAEAASVAFIRARVHPDGERLQLAAADGIYWLVLGIPLAALCYGLVLNMTWTEVTLVALKQSINGVLNAALAGAFLIAVRYWRSDGARIPIRKLLFTILMLAILLPALFVSTWQNRRLSEMAEQTASDTLGLAIRLALARIEQLQSPVTPEDVIGVLPEIQDQLGRLSPSAFEVSLSIDNDPCCEDTDQDQPPFVIRRPELGLEVLPTDDTEAPNIIRWRLGECRTFTRVEGVEPTVHLIARMGTGDALVGLRQAQLELFGQLGMITFVALLAAFYAARRLSRPIAALAEVAAGLPSHLFGAVLPVSPPTGALREVALVGEALGRMEIALRDSFRVLSQAQERYRLLVEHQTDLLVRVDATGCFQYASPTYCALFGLEEHSIIGRHYMPLVHPQDQEATLKAWQSLFDPPHTCQVDQRVMTVDGYRWIQWSDTALLDDTGQVSAVFAIGRDITDRKHAEERLRYSEARFRAVFEQATIGMAILGNDRCARFVNSSLERILGRDAFTLKRLSLDELTHPDDRQSDSVLFEQLVAGSRHSYRVVKRFLKPDGSLAWVDLSVNLLPAVDGGAPIPFALLEDITQRRRAEDARAKAEGAVQRYSTNLEDFSRLTATYGPTEDALPKLLDYGCRTLGIEAAAFWEPCDQGFRLVSTAGPARLQRGARFTETRPVRVIGTDARTRWPEYGGDEHPVFGGNLCFHLRWRLVWDDARGQEKWGLLAFASRRTVPELGNPEHQILHLLIQRISAHLREQAVLEGLLHARERAFIGHLAGGVAHDFNNVLGVVMTNVHLLERLVRAVPNLGEALEILDETRGAVNQAKVVTSGLLSLGREGAVRVESCDLSALVTGFAPVIRRLLPPRVSLDLDLEPNVWVSTHPAMLQAALLNLALNGRDAMGGRGCLTLRVARAKAGDDLRPAVGKICDGDHGLLEVADTGIGMSDAVRSRIFEPLFSTKQRGKGTGLGLFMVGEFVLRTGGVIDVLSTEGEGSRFRLYLPAAQTMAAADPAVIEQVLEIDGNGERAYRILLVDDNPQLRTALGRRLQMAGYSVEQAADGAEALNLVTRGTGFDLVLCDIVMPVLDGLGLYSALCCDYPDLPVILMSGDPDAVAQAASLDPEIPVLHKPIEDQDLKGAIGAAMAQSHPHDGFA